MQYKNTLYTLAAIFICLAFGYATFALFDLLPASLYGMCFFAIGLHLNVFDAKRVEETVSFMIKNISVCFVPAGVGIMNYFDLLKTSGWQLLLFTIVTTFVLMVMVGWLYQRATKATEGRKGKKRKKGEKVKNANQAKNAATPVNKLPMHKLSMNKLPPNKEKAL